MGNQLKSSCSWSATSVSSSCYYFANYITWSVGQKKQNNNRNIIIKYILDKRTCRRIIFSTLEKIIYNIRNECDHYNNRVHCLYAPITALILVVTRVLETDFKIYYLITVKYIVYIITIKKFKK